MGQEIQFSLKMKIHYHVHKIQKMNPMLSEMNSNHNFITYFPNIDFNIILPIKPRSQRSIHHAWFLIKTLNAIIIFQC